MNFFWAIPSASEFYFDALFGSELFLPLEVPGASAASSLGQPCGAGVGVLDARSEIPSGRQVHVAWVPCHSRDPEELRLSCWRPVKTNLKEETL